MRVRMKMKMKMEMEMKMKIKTETKIIIVCNENCLAWKMISLRIFHQSARLTVESTRGHSHPK